MGMQGCYTIDIRIFSLFVFFIIICTHIQTTTLLHYTYYTYYTYKVTKPTKTNIYDYMRCSGRFGRVEYVIVK